MATSFVIVNKHANKKPKKKPVNYQYWINNKLYYNSYLHMHL